MPLFREGSFAARHPTLTKVVIALTAVNIVLHLYMVWINWEWTSQPAMVQAVDFATGDGCTSIIVGRRERQHKSMHASTRDTHLNHPTAARARALLHPTSCHLLIHLHFHPQPRARR